MSENKASKKKVFKEWGNNFPQLTPYTQNKFYKIVGCLIIGIELIQLPDKKEYRPYFVIYPLWKTDIKKCFETPLIIKVLYNKNGMQLNLSYEQSNTELFTTLEFIKTQCTSFLENDVSVKNILKLIDEYSKTPPLSAKSDSYLQAKIKESLFQICLYNNNILFRDILERINKFKWDQNNFNYFGVNLQEWLQNLNQRVNKREDLLNQVETNKLNEKISTLKSSQFTS